MPTATLQSPRLPEGLGGDEVLPPPEEQGNNGWPFCRDLLVERSPAILAPWGGKAFTWPGGAKQAQGRQAVGGGPLEQEDRPHPQGCYREKGASFFFKEPPKKVRGTHWAP